MKPLPASQVTGNTEAERFDNAVRKMFAGETRNAIQLSLSHQTSANNGEQWSVLENVGAGAAVAGDSPRIADLLQRRLGRWAGSGWSSCRGNAIVEHKAQTHNGSFALISHLGSAVYSAAHVYL
jgi:hypothetical protein